MMSGMKRLRRWLFNLLAAVSLTLCLVMCVSQYRRIWGPLPQRSCCFVLSPTSSGQKWISVWIRPYGIFLLEEKFSDNVPNGYVPVPRGFRPDAKETVDRFVAYNI